MLPVEGLSSALDREVRFHADLPAGNWQLQFLLVPKARASKALAPLGPREYWDTLVDEGCGAFAKVIGPACDRLQLCLELELIVK